MKTWIHGVGGLLGMALITLFFSTSLIVELVGDTQAVVRVKQLIVYGLVVLVPTMMITGILGRAVVGRRQGRLITTKIRRMMVVAGNGIVILIPCALVLQRSAAAGTFDRMFYLVQGVEFVAGAVNIVLMGMNMRDGLLLTGRIKKKQSHPDVSIASSQ